MNLEIDILQQYQITFERAVELYNLFESTDEVAQLIVAYSNLKQEVERLNSFSEFESEKYGNLRRHLHFLEYYLKLNQKDNCKDDIKDIILYDLPTTFKNIVLMFSNMENIDQQLRISISSLIDAKQYDSAIRKLFIILSERLRNIFRVDDKEDGEKLINEIFGKNSEYSIKLELDEEQKTSYRNLLSGLYGLYRNKYAHKNVSPSYTEMKAIFGMVNNIILELENISSDKIIDSENKQ